jgi:ADP-ribose pyrophosphatase YjhB (NUDIX family)
VNLHLPSPSASSGRSPAFCPQCGNALAARQLESEDRVRLVCTSCSYVFYQNPRIVVVALPIVGGKVVLLRRAIPPQIGTWTMPAGFMELGETAEEAAVRETLEETCLDVRIRALFNVYSRAEAGIVNLVYLADVIGGEAQVTREAQEIGHFGPDDIPWDNLAFVTTRWALRDWVDGTGLAR